MNRLVDALSVNFDFMEPCNDSVYETVRVLVAFFQDTRQYEAFIYGRIFFSWSCVLGFETVTMVHVVNGSMEAYNLILQA